MKLTKTEEKLLLRRWEGRIPSYVCIQEPVTEVAAISTFRCSNKCVAVAVAVAVARLHEPKMESLKSPFLFSTPLLPPTPSQPHHHCPITNKNKKKKPITRIHSSVQRDPWSLRDGDPTRPKPRSLNPKNPLSDDNARRIIKAKARYLGVLRRNQGPQAQTPRWIKRTPEQMVQYLRDDRHGHLYGKHVVAAIKKVRALSQRVEGDYDMRMVMGSFVGKLSFREMCVVLKEQKGWRQVRDFFAWMKLQVALSFSPFFSPDSFTYLSLVQAYSVSLNYSAAEETIHAMRSKGVPPSCAHFNILILVNGDDGSLIVAGYMFGGNNRSTPVWPVFLPMMMGT